MILTLLVSLHSFCDITKQKQSKLLYFCIFSILLVFAGFRDEHIGSDTFVYYKYYQEVARTGAFLFEPLYSLLVYLFAKIFQLDFYWFSFTIAFLSLGLKFKAFYKFSPSLFIPILYYFSDYYLAQDFNQVRQGLASGVILLSIGFLHERQIKKYVITVFVAILIHTSSVFFLLFPLFIWLSERSRVELVAVVCVSYLCIFLDLNGFLMRMLDSLGGVFLDTTINKKIMLYADGNQYTQQTGFYLGSLAQLYFVFIYIFYKGKVNNSFYNLLLAVFVVGTSAYFFFSSVSILMRLGHVALAFGGILYAYVVAVEKKMYVKILLIGVLILISAYKMHGYLDTYSEVFIPYKMSNIIK